MVGAYAKGIGFHRKSGKAFHTIGLSLYFSSANILAELDRAGLEHNLAFFVIEPVKACPQAWRRIGEEVSETLDFEPARFIKRRSHFD